MLQTIADGKIADANIVYGTRNQFASYPAMTYLVTENNTMTIGPSPTKMCQVTIKSVHTTAEDSIALANDIEDQLVAGTYNAVEFCAVLNKNSVLEQPESGNGEESNPFVATTTATIYYKE